MRVIRSALFMALMLVFTPIYVLCLLCFFWLPIHTRRRLAMPWVHSAMFMIRHVLGIRHRVLGAENIPGKACVILCKHQSAWETIALQQIFPDTIFVLKKELHWLPFFGWALAMMPFIAIDRSAGKNALRQVVQQGKARLGEGYSVIIFPEGTRVAPGQARRFKAGGAVLAHGAGAPAVPVALTSGECWPRQAFLKTPGTITVSIGPVLDGAELSSDDINSRAEAWIEAEMRNISPKYHGQENAPTHATA
jgi:1-acyl-sn-glycerol-3-phosphate acyltransferase